MIDLDISLVKKAQKGNVKAFEKLVLKYEKKIYNLVLKILENEQDAYDVSQEVFIKVFDSLHTFSYSSKFSTWLYRIAVNKAIDQVRKKKKKNSIEVLDNSDTKNIDCIELETYESPEKKVIRNEFKNQIVDLLNKLSEEQKMIIILRDIEQYSYKEISEILDCSIGTVKSRISRSRKNFKEIYLEYLEQTEEEKRLNI